MQAINGGNREQLFFVERLRRGFHDVFPWQNRLKLILILAQTPPYLSVQVRLCEVEANTQASIISVAALTQTAFAIYLQTHLHDHPSQFVSMPEVGMAAMWCVAGFLAVAAAAMWVVYLSARRGWALQHWHQALSAATSGVAMLW